MRKGRLLLAVTLFALGCSLFNQGEEPQLSQGQVPILNVNQLDSLKLETIRQVFPPGDDVTVESLRYRSDVQDATLGGRYAFTPTVSITVRVYGGEHGGKAGLAALMEDAVLAYQLVEPTQDLPLTWWYRLGPPATVIFDYGNTLTTIRLGILEPDTVRKTGADAVRTVATRILRCSRGLPVGE